MKTSRINLSICIATYNRGAFIGATLDSIVCQAIDGMEIVVLDGGSKDDTAQVVRGYQQHFPRLRYFRQCANMGVDHDFAEAVRLAEGEYCWLFSDDDILKPGAIQTVLNAIRGQYAVIITNAEVCNATLSTVLEPKRLQMTSDRIYKPNETEHLLADCGKYLSFIGCVIIKKVLWDEREKKRYFGSYFVHVGVIFQTPLPHDALVIAAPLISIRYGNAMWLSKYFETWMLRWPTLIWSLTDYSDKVKVQVCPKEPWRSVGRLFLHRARGAYTISEYKDWVEPRLSFGLRRIVIKAIAYFPGRMANFLAVLHYSVVSRNSARLLVLVDMANSPFHFWKSPWLHK